VQERVGDFEDRLREVESRVNKHEAVCEERYKQIFAELRNMTSLIRTVGLMLLTGMAGVIISQVMP
jgi:hypothetical protein